MATAAERVEIGDFFGSMSMEEILICGVPSTFKKIWDTTSKLKKEGKSLPRNSL